MADAFRTLAQTAPTSPRELSADIESDSAEHGRFLRLFGGIWTTVGLGLAILFSFLALALELRTYSLGAGLVSGFGVVGGALWMIGWWQRRAALRTYRDGVEARGVVIDIWKDLKVRMNGRSPWRVAYEYVADGRPMRGRATFWDVAPPRVTIGDRVIVLHAKEQPTRSVLWTRFEHGASEAPLETQLHRIGAPVAHDTAPSTAEREAEALAEFEAEEPARRSL